MIGRKLGNRYEVIERIGGGGMAVVYRALDTLLNRSVSIKVLRAQFSTDEEFVRRFRREAQAAASLSHPNVVNIYDVGTEGEDYYIVMEYIDGVTLKEMIQDRAPLPVAEAIDVAKQICSALGHAHENNIVHRDIKPHNILIGKDGRVKVTDFGIARAITSNTITQDGSVLGSVHYFSPEQARGGITDVKSDIYSLGVVLYEMVTGELPFSGESPISVALKHLQEHFVEPRQINPALPQSVENIVLKALAKDPTVRYQSAREMHKDLEKALLYPNVPKFTVPLFDDQKTIQMPAVGLRQAAAEAAARTEAAKPQPTASVPTNSVGSSSSGSSHDEERVAKPAPAPAAKKPEEPKGKKVRKFWGPVVWLLLIFVLLGVGAVTAYTLVTHYMSAKDVVMPDETGKTFDDAVKDLVSKGFDINNIHRDDTTSDKPANTVLKQDQYPGKTVKANRDLTLTVSSGPQKIAMPKLIGLKKDDAMAALHAKGFDDKNITINTKEDESTAPDTVLDQSPSTDDTVTKDQKITITVAKAPATVQMPNLEGLTVDDAKSRLNSLGLKVGQIVQSQSDSVQKDRIVRTLPYSAGAAVQKGETIDLYVSTGPAQTPPPSSSDTGTKRITEAVTVNVPGGSKVAVKIVKNDMTGTNTVIEETINATKTYNVTCVVAKDQMASIDVYKDGVKQTIAVPYDSANAQSQNGQ